VNATPGQAGEVQGYLRGLLSELASKEVAQTVRILYGGSVKAENVEALMAEPEVDGALVGGASLTVQGFIGIVRKAARISTASKEWAGAHRLDDHSRPGLLRHHRHRPAAVGQGRRHRLGIRRRRQPGRVRLDGHTDLARQDHDWHRHRLHADVVHARHAGRRARELGPARSAAGERAARARGPDRSPRSRSAHGSGADAAAVMGRGRGALFRLSGPLLLLALAGCSGEADSSVEVAASQAPGKPAYGDTYIEALPANISGLIPNVLTDGPSFDVAGVIYSGLVKYDKDLNIRGAPAEAGQYSADCLDLTFKLRQNVQWHDHQPFTAADVVFTYDTMVNPKTPTAYGSDFKAVESVRAVDPYTVRVRYKHASA